MILSVSRVKTRLTPSGGLEVDLLLTMPSGEASSVSLAPALSSRATEDARALLREMPPSARPGP